MASSPRNVETLNSVVSTAIGKHGGTAGFGFQED